MKKRIIVLSLLVTAIVAGCGLVSGTVFVSQDVSGTVESQVGTTLDSQFRGAVVDLTDNSDWKKITIDGVEDVCIRMTASNLRNEAVSGEVWIVEGTDTTGIHSKADIQSHGGFRIFHGLALAANEQNHVFTCMETLHLLENIGRLSDVVKNGKFSAWGIGDQDVYHITFEGIVFGIHVTGSL